MRRTPALAAALATALLAAAAAGQQLKVQTPGGPHYLGTPIDVRVVATDFEEEPAPEIRVDPPAAGRLELLGVTPKVTVLPSRPGEISRYVADISKARRLLDYEPTTFLREGVHKAVAWSGLSPG